MRSGDFLSSENWVDEARIEAKLSYKIGMFCFEK